MQTADFDHNVFSATQQEADKGIRVKFYTLPINDRKATEEKGRPIFRDTEMIEMMIPGDRQTKKFKVNQGHMNRFPDAYRKWKDGQSQEDGMGMPLSEYPKITRSMAEELAYFNIKTVEQLANMADTQASKFMGGGNLKAEAAKWLENAESERPFLEMEAHNQEMRAQMSDMADVIKGLKEQLDAQGNRGKSDVEKGIAAREAGNAAERALEEMKTPKKADKKATKG